MSTALMVFGMVLTAAGAIYLIRPPQTADVAESAIKDVSELLAKFNELLDRFDKKYRPGLVLMAVGLAFVGLGVFLESHDAKDAAESATTALIGIG